MRVFTPMNPTSTESPGEHDDNAPEVASAMPTTSEMFTTSATDAGWMLDVLSEPINRYRVADRVIVYCNQAWADQYRVERSDAIGRHLDDFLSADELDGLHAQLALIGPDDPVLVDTVARVDSGEERRWLQWVDHYVVTETGPEILSVGRDVTERHVAEQALAESEQRFRTLADASSDVVWRARRPGFRFDYISPSVYRLLGYQPSWFLEDGARVLQVACRETREMVQRLFANGEWPELIDLHLHDADGQVVIVESSITYGEHAIHGIGRDVTEIRNLQTTLATDATTDALTGLANRRCFDETLRSELRRVSATSTDLAVVYVDLDRLKEINDRHGHDAGDRVLRECGRRLLASADGADTVARLGGDEFAIIHEIRGDSIDRIVERVAHHIATPIAISPARSLVCDASLGVATSRDHGHVAAHVVAAADRAMYEHKRRTRPNTRA